MTIQDMDICLNISTEPIAGHKKQQEKKKYADQRYNKHSQKKSSVKDGSSIADKSIVIKKRVKQKSLASIVANKLKTIENNSKTPSTVIIGNATKKNIKNESSKPETVNESSSSKCNDNTDTSSEPTFSFVKPPKNINNTIVAKKRTINENTKKSLSDIFSVPSESDKSETNLLKLNESNCTSSSNIPFKKRKQEDTTLLKIQNKSQVSLQSKKLNKNNRDTGNNETKVFNKTGGKISSLFGHNPEIPNIGQRFVKPVAEKVFTEKTFKDFGIHPFAVSNLEQNLNITKMTTVQQKAIPEIFKGKDVLIRSQTGSGKTLTYALPIVEFLHKIRPKLSRSSGLKALIVVPTRELALQTYECFLKLIKPFTWIVPGYLIGGEKRKAEKARLRKGCNILIVTPGRLLDHIKHTEALRLSDIKYFVLDEADRMLDMGYEKDISEIVSQLKVANSSDSEYNPMMLFRQNVKKKFTDEELETAEQNISQVSDTENDKQSDSVVEDDNCTTKGVYHSNSESENEEEEKVLKNKKLIKIKNSSKDTEICSAPVANDLTENNSRQTILLSATLTHAVEKLAGLAMNNPIFVDAAKDNLESAGGNMNEINEDLVVPQSVIQTYIVTPPKLRMVTLCAYIVGKCQSAGGHKILIFMATQDMLDYHTEIMSSVLGKPMDDEDEDSDPLVDVEFFKLHGSMTQKDRTEVFKTFRAAKTGVLLCTDVAARGLDLPKVDCVVQYTGPLSARDYVHRIGRTARAGSSGSATIFLTPPEIEFVRMLESRRIRIKQENMDDVLGKLLRPLSKHNSVHSAAIALQNDFETLVLENKKLHDQACKAYTSWIRFYASYPRDMRQMFNRKDLHLGHYAKSFALREPPQRIGGIGKTLQQKEGPKPQHNNRLTVRRPEDEQNQKSKPKPKGHVSQDSGRNVGLLKRVRMLNTSEYDSGLDFLRNKPRKP